jgi:hypothetical protein
MRKAVHADPARDGRKQAFGEGHLRCFHARVAVKSAQPGDQPEVDRRADERRGVEKRPGGGRQPSEVAAGSQMRAFSAQGWRWIVMQYGERLGETYLGIAGPPTTWDLF